MDITVTTRINLLSMPSTNTRTTAFKRANPARFLGEGNGPIKNLLPISITQREHPPHLSEPGLTQGTPVPLLRALLQGQTQQILRRHGILQKHRQLRPILPQITHNTTPNQHPHTHQHHTPTRPRNKTATNPTVHHAPIQPHHPPHRKQSDRRTEITTSHENKPHRHAPPVQPVKPPDQTTCDDDREHASRFRTHPNFTHPHSRLLKNPDPDYQIGHIIVGNKDATFTSRVIFLTMPYHIGR